MASHAGPKKILLTITHEAASQIKALVAFTPGVPVQPEGAVDGLRLFYSGVPILGTMLAMWIMRDYDLDERRATEVNAELARSPRRWRARPATRSARCMPSSSSVASTACASAATRKTNAPAMCSRRRRSANASTSLRRMRAGCPSSARRTTRQCWWMSGLPSTARPASRPQGRKDVPPDDAQGSLF